MIYKNRSLKNMSDCIISHINSRIRKRFNEPIIVPGKARPKTICSRTSVLPQPSNCSLKIISDVIRIQLHFRKTFFDFSTPFGLAIVQVPLSVEL